MRAGAAAEGSGAGRAGPRSPRVFARIPRAERPRLGRGWGLRERWSPGIHPPEQRGWGHARVRALSQPCREFLAWSAARFALGAFFLKFFVFIKSRANQHLNSPW